MVSLMIPLGGNPLVGPRRTKTSGSWSSPSPLAGRHRLRGRPGHRARRDLPDYDRHARVTALTGLITLPRPAYTLNPNSTPWPFTVCGHEAGHALPVPPGRQNARQPLGGGLHLAALGASMRMIFTLWGHAQSSKRAMAGDVVALMCHLGHDRFSVVGHDRGSLVAFRTAMDHPDSIERLVVMDVADVDRLGELVETPLSDEDWSADRRLFDDSLTRRSGQRLARRSVLDRLVGLRRTTAPDEHPDPDDQRRKYPDDR